LKEFQESAVRYKEDYRISQWKSHLTLEIFKRIVREFLKYEIKIPPLIKELLILDVGCGPGSYLPLLSKYGDICAFDFSTEMLKIVRNRYNDSKGLMLCVGDTEKMPFKDGSFDVILCVGVLQHVDDPRSVVRELGRVVKELGKVLIITLNKYFLFRRNSDELKEYSIEELRQLSREAGLRPKNHGYVFVPPFKKMDFIRRIVPKKFVSSAIFVILEKENIQK